MARPSISTVILGVTLSGISPIESNVDRSVNMQLRLHFPVTGYNQDTAKIRNTFDHSADGPYLTSNEVIAYTGEEASIRMNDQGCMGQSVSSAFVVNGHYVGADFGPAALCYDAHPGYDFAAAEGTPVIAAASGFVRYPDLYHSISANIHNTLEIEHTGTNCSTLYLHMNDRFFADGEYISAGQVVGTVGNIGTSSFYLHFEVQCDGKPVDPYGWTGDGPDPYYQPNVMLWGAKPPGRQT